MTTPPQVPLGLYQLLIRLGALCALCIYGATPALAQTQKRAAMLVFAQEAPPPTLDPYFSTSISTRNVAMHIFETLVTRDETNAVVPELADKITESTDGLSYTFNLRRGVKFHNGAEMTSADVKASLERYKRVALQKVTKVELFTAPCAQWLRRFSTSYDLQGKKMQSETFAFMVT